MKSRIFSRPSIFKTSHMLLAATLLSVSSSGFGAVATTTMPTAATAPALSGMKIRGLAGIFPCDLSILYAQIDKIRYYLSSGKSIPGTPKNRFILYGTPGNGKRSAAQKLAIQAEASVVELSIPALFCCTEEEGISYINKTFDEARALASKNEHVTILIIDGLEEIIASTQEIQETFWKNLDTLKKDSRIVLVGTVNKEHVNSLLLTRFSSCLAIEIQNQPKFGREEVLQFYWKKHSQLTTKNVFLLRTIAEKTEAFSCQALEELIDGAFSAARSNGTIEPNEKDLLQLIPVIKKMNYGSSAERLKKKFGNFEHKIEKAEHVLEKTTIVVSKAKNFLKKMGDAWDQVSNWNDDSTPTK